MNFSFSYDKEFDELINTLKSKYGEELFTLDGIGRQTDLHLFSKEFFNNSNATADISTDANANVCGKTGIEYDSEFSKPFKRFNSYFLLWKELKRRYSIDVANEIIEAQITGRIYINDASSVSMPYCFNYSTFDIYTNGLVNVSRRLKIEPPKSLEVFLRQVEQFIAIAANSTLGATGLADLLIVASLYVDKIFATGFDHHIEVNDPLTYIKEKLIALVYTLNWEFRQAQSAFTNVSLYDDVFLDSLCPDYGANKETVKILQQLYVDVMNEEMKRTPLTFPVTTACFAIDDNKEIIDHEFLNFVAEANKEFAFINIYNGTTATLSSCCFRKDTQLYWKENLDDSVKIASFNDLYEKFGEGGEIFVCNPYLPEKNYWSEARLVKAEGTLYELCLKDAEKPVYVTEDHIHITSGNVLKKTAELSDKDNLAVFNFKTLKIDYCSISSIKKATSIKEDVYCVECKNEESPYFCINIGKNDYGLITHNCRLRSNKENEYFNSFGAGSSKIGSLGVLTANIPRCAMDTMREFSDSPCEKQVLIENFLERVKKLFIMQRRVNACKRILIQKRIDLGAAPLYSNGYMALIKQYSTFGVVGINEAVQILGYDILTEEGQELVCKLLDTINEWIDEAQKEEKTPHNVEQVPAETSSIKLAQKDKYMGYDVSVPLYSNQFIPLTTKADMLDRLRLQGMFDSKLSGGAIAHINIGTKIEDTETMISLMKYAAKCGVVYWGMNYRLNCCENKHTWVGTDHCPTCGKEWETQITRVN